MSITLPESPGQLRWLLARRLSAAAIVIGTAAGGASWLLETRRVEQAAAGSAASAARHFTSPAIQLLREQPADDEHEALTRLLDRSHFVGIRVFDRDRKLAYERWADIPAGLIAAVKVQRHDWPAPDGLHRNWIDVGAERLIQVIAPLTTSDGRRLGFVESITRLDVQTLQAQRDQIRSSALTAVIAVLATALLLYPLLLAMLRRSVDLSRRLLDANLSLLRALGNAIAKRDSDTDAHNYRVTFYAVALAEAMGLPPGEVAGLVVGAFLHDVGKIGIPDHILLKPGKLTREEFEVMKTHVHLGLEIVKGNPWLESAAQVIHHHHERFDGTGYPDALRGSTIPMSARIFAVADVFDALTSVRPYKASIPPRDALRLVLLEYGRHFDPAVVRTFVEIAPMLNAQLVLARSEAAELRLRMRLLLARYFKTDAAPEGAASEPESAET